MIAAQTESSASVCWIEHQTLEHIKGALRVTVDWRAPAVSLSRKQSSIRFALQSFCRHLERLMAIEEAGGYMAEVSETKPYLDSQIRRLAEDHAHFRARLRDLGPRVDSIADWQDDEFNAVCDEIRDFLDEVDRHDHAEVKLLCDTMTMDVGGEG